MYQAADFDDSMLVFNSSKSEYTEYSVQQAYNANNGAGGIIDALNSNKDRKHILVFVPSVQDAIDLSQRYENSAVIYGDMDKRQRDFVISEFRAGRIRVIFNVRVLSTGFDYTGIDCIDSRHFNGLNRPVLPNHRACYTYRRGQTGRPHYRPRRQCSPFRQGRGHHI